MLLSSMVDLLPHLYRPSDSALSDALHLCERRHRLEQCTLHRSVALPAADQLHHQTAYQHCLVCVRLGTCS